MNAGQHKYGNRQALLGTGQKLQALSCLRRARTAFHLDRLEGAEAWKWDPHCRRSGTGSCRENWSSGSMEFAARKAGQP